MAAYDLYWDSTCFVNLVEPEADIANAVAKSAAEDLFVDAVGNEARPTCMLPALAAKAGLNTSVSESPRHFCILQLPALRRVQEP